MHCKLASRFVSLARAPLLRLEANGALDALISGPIRKVCSSQT
jgi:hypothetical protein